MTFDVEQRLCPTGRRHAMAFCAPRPLPLRKTGVSSVSFRCAISSPKSDSKEKVSPSIADKPFSTWATSNKIDMSAVSLTKDKIEASGTEGLLRGMTATTALKKGDQLISVSRKPTLQVTSLDGKKSPIPEQISGASWQKLPWFARLALLLLNAKIDPESDLQLWIERLPKSFDTPFHWSDKELLELQNQKMIQSVHEQRSLYRRLYNEINGNVDNALARKLKYDDFIWAVECIRSRAFSGPLEVAPFKERISLVLFIIGNTLAWPAIHLLPWQNALNGGLTAMFAMTMYDILTPKILKVVRGFELKRYAMTPGIDMMNHSSTVTGKAEVSYEYFSEKFVVQAGEDYESGDQVFISYGAQGNDAFLQYYGFVEEGNSAETYTFGREIEQVLGVPTGSLVARTNSGFDDSSIRAVAKKLGGSKESARKVLAELCNAELSGMETSLEEDLEILKRDDRSDPRSQLALRYRIERKRLLMAAAQ